MRKGNLKNLIIYGVCSEVLYLSFLFIEPLTDKIFADNLNFRDALKFFLVLSILLFLIAFYIKSLTNLGSSKKIFRYIVGFGLLFNLTLFFIKPITSTDLYMYLSHSRIYSKYHQNPYVTPYSHFPDDNLYQTLDNIFADKTAFYGPLFVLLGSVFTFAAGDSLLLNIYLLKGFFVILNILSIFLISKLFKDNRTTLLYAWNPMILFELSLNAHNEVVLIFLLLISLYLLLTRRSIKSYLASWIFLVLSFLIKFSTALLTPFYLIYTTNKIKKRLDKMKFVGLALTSAIFLLTITYLPFWQGPKIFSTSLRIVSNYSPFVSLGITAFLKLFSFFGISDNNELAILVSRLVFVIIYFLVLIRFFKLALAKRGINDQQFVFFLVIIFSIFFATFFNWLMPWYFTSLIALICVYAGLVRNYRRKVFASSVFIYLITIYAAMNYFGLR